MALKQLSDGGPDGSSLGQNAADKVALHGVTPVAQASVPLSAAVTAATTIVPLATAYAELYLALKAKGIVA